jgi:FixJ family two-component response regulator
MSRTRSTIAVVEDDTGVRTALEQLLRAAGFFALTFASAEEFLRSELTMQIDCIVADINLPGMSGVALLKTLASSGGIPTGILITGRDDAATADLTRQSPDVPCLRKPFSDEALFGAIRSILGA